MTENDIGIGINPGTGSPEPGRHITRRFVLEDPFGEREVGAWATSLGWRKVQEIAAEREEGIERQVIWSAADVASIHYLEDMFFGEPYYLLSGPRERTVEALAAQAEADLRPWSIAELCRAHDTAPSDFRKAKSAYLLAIAGSSAYDERVFTRISAVLQNPEPKARDMALHAVVYADYAEFLPVLDHLAAHDPEDWLRSEARAIRDELAALREVPAS